MTIECELILDVDRNLTAFKHRLGILIPAYNEALHLSKLLSACRMIEPVSILVVDDCSTDNTPQILIKEVDNLVSALRNPRNIGKQGAIRRGLCELVKQNIDAIAIIDGDGQHDPYELPQLASLLNRYDFIIGARYRNHMPIQRVFSNWLGNFMFRLIGGVDFVDVQSGLRIYSKQLAEVLAEHLPEKGGYALEYESITLLARYAQECGVVLNAAATPISCAYGHAQSFIGPKHVLHVSYEAIRQAVRFRKALYKSALIGVD